MNQIIPLNFVVLIINSVTLPVKLLLFLEATLCFASFMAAWTSVPHKRSDDFGTHFYSFWSINIVDTEESSFLFMGVSPTETLETLDKLKGLPHSLYPPSKISKMAVRGGVYDLVLRKGV